MRKSLLVGLLGLVLAGPSLAGLNPTIDHRPVACVVADRFARLVARFAPGETVAAARVVFQPENSDQWWAVLMKPEGTGYVGVLPKPRRVLRAVRYYVEVTDKSLATARTPDVIASVVSSAGECKGKLVAGELGAAAISLQSAAGGAAGLPAGFASSGVAAGSAAGGAAAAGAAAAGGISTGLLIAGGAAVAGAGAAVAASQADGKRAASPAPCQSDLIVGHWVGDQTITNSGTGQSCVDDITYDFQKITCDTFSGTGTTLKRASAGCSVLAGRYDPVTGSLSNGAVSFSQVFVVPGASCPGSASGSFVSTTRITGTSSGQCANISTTGTFTINRQ